MQKVVIDTNVLVASLIKHGYPNLTVKELLANRDIGICISESLFAEYVEVLQRDKFSSYPDFQANAQNLLLDIEMIGKRYYPEVKYDIIADQDDNKLLELSVTCQADFLITGNTNDFTMKEFEGTKIITPKEYWTRYRLG